MATSIRNKGGFSATLPSPFRGVLGPGKAAIIDAESADVIAAFGPLAGTSWEIRQVGNPAPGGYDDFATGSFRGPQPVKVSTVLTSNDTMILADATSSALTVTLPAATLPQKTISIKKTDASANDVIVLAPDGSTIDGLMGIFTATQNDTLVAVSDGTNWWVQSASAAFNNELLAVANYVKTAWSSTPEVVTLWGQSNMAAVSRVTKGYSAMTAFLGAQLLGWDPDTDAFVNVVDGSANAKSNAPATGPFGAGPGLGQVGTPYIAGIAAALGSPVKTFAMAFTGQSITYFKPDSLTNAFFEDGSQATRNNYNETLFYVTTSGESVKQILFCQGQADSGMTQTQYYDHFKALVAQAAIDHPEAHWLVCPVVGSTVAAVRAAQLELVSENPHMRLVSNADLISNTVYFGSAFDPNHYSTLGYKTLSARCTLALTGATHATLPSVAAVRDTLSSVVAVWSGDILSVHDAPNAGKIANIQSDVGGLSLAVVPTRDLADVEAPIPAMNDVAGARMNGTNSAYSATLTGASGDEWTIMGVGQLDDTDPVQTIFEVIQASGRISIMGANNSLKPGIGVDGTFYTSGDLPGVSTTDTNPHVWAIVYDGPGLEWRYYLDGVLEHTETIVSAETMTSPVLYWGALAGSQWWWDGLITTVVVAETVHDDATIALASSALELGIGI